MKGLVQLVGLLTVTSAVTGRSPKCPKTDSDTPLFFADERDKSAFWQCGHGTAYHMRCDKQLVWNAELNVCDWPSSVEADDEDSGQQAGAASDSYNQEPLIHIVKPLDIGDIEERIRSIEGVAHETLLHYNLEGDWSTFHMGHAKRPVEDIRHPKTPVEDFRYTKRPVEEPRYTRRPVEDLENSTRLLEGFGHTKRPMEDHVDHAQLMRSIFHLTDFF